jgi:hypothetical protein
MGVARLLGNTTRRDATRRDATQARERAMHLFVGVRIRCALQHAMHVRVSHQRRTRASRAWSVRQRRRGRVGSPPPRRTEVPKGVCRKNAVRATAPSRSLRRRLAVGAHACAGALAGARRAGAACRLLGRATALLHQQGETRNVRRGHVFSARQHGADQKRTVQALLHDTQSQLSPHWRAARSGAAVARRQVRVSNAQRRVEGGVESCHSPLRGAPTARNARAAASAMLTRTLSRRARSRAHARDARARRRIASAAPLLVASAAAPGTSRPWRRRTRRRHTWRTPWCRLGG